MTLRSDQKALLFLGAVAVLGAGVRVLRAASGRPDTGAQPALERQVQAADSAARAGRGKSSGGKGAKNRTTKQSAKRNDVRPQATAAANAGTGLLDRPGYVGGRLDLDIATAAQIDSLPGVGPAMAKRIVRDRIERGPFVTRDGLRRVPGTGPTFMARIESLVTFSGIVRHPNPADTVIPGRRKN